MAYFDTDAILEGITGGLDELASVFEKRKAQKDEVARMVATYQAAINAGMAPREAQLLVLNPDAAKTWATIESLKAGTAAVRGEETRIREFMKTHGGMTPEVWKTEEDRKAREEIARMREGGQLQRTRLNIAGRENVTGMQQTGETGRTRLNIAGRKDVAATGAASRITTEADKAKADEKDAFVKDGMSLYEKRLRAASTNEVGYPVDITPEMRERLRKEAFEDVFYIKQQADSLFSGGGATPPPRGDEIPVGVTAPEDGEATEIPAGGVEYYADEVKKDFADPSTAPEYYRQAVLKQIPESIREQLRQMLGW